jgi:hypothetical protein
MLVGSGRALSSPPDLFGFDVRQWISRDLGARPRTSRHPFVTPEGGKEARAQAISPLIGAGNVCWNAKPATSLS